MTSSSGHSPTLCPLGCWLIILGLASISCSGAPPSSSPSILPLEASHEQHGIQFETTTSRPIPSTLPPKSKIGLIHQDRDDADRRVRVTLEQAIFSLKTSIPSLIVVERRRIDDIEKEFRFQSSGKVSDQDLAKIGHFLGLDYVVVFDPIYQDLNELYGLRNQIEAWEVRLALKIVAVNTAEMKLHCLATAKAAIGKQMTAAEVRGLNQEALDITTSLVSQCLSASLQDTAVR